MIDWKEALKARVLKQQRKLNEKCDNLVQIIESGKVDGNMSGELERRWLESFTGDGKLGLNLCCGNFTIGNTLGVDLNRRLLGVDIAMNIDDVYTLGTNNFDCIVTNHIESTVSPSRIFFSIHSVLKNNGVLAIVFVNSDIAENIKEIDDVLMSAKKVSLFNRTIMKYYLRKAGFKSVEITDSSSPSLLRVLARK